MWSTITSLGVTSLLILSSYVVFLYLKKTQVRYPPGPTPKPIVGNVFDIPLTKQCLVYLDWSRQFASDTIHVSALNTHIFILHKQKDVNELLEKRSAIYSSRPAIPILKFTKTAELTPALPYGVAFQKQRRILHGVFKKQAIPSYHDIQVEKVHVFLSQLLQNPVKFRCHCKMLAISVIMATVFGYEVKAGEENGNDRFIKLAEIVGNECAELVLPGRTLLNVFPFLNYIPTWFPGAATQRIVSRIAHATVEHKNGPFEYVKSRMVAGTSKDCILERLLKSRTERAVSETFGDNDIHLKDAMASIYSAGVDTVWSALSIFILTIVLHPLQQKKAQEEIDRVIGSDRLPTFNDRPSLPYVDALLREALRFRPVTPLGFPHTALEDDTYNGFDFPKDALVIPNVWAITRDETLYQDSESFKPERFLEEDGTLNDDHVSYVFGFGRRFCPGRHFADALLWMATVSVLSTFNISKARDENGIEIDVDKDAFTDSFIRCSIVPRSPQAEALLRGAAIIGPRKE